MHGAWVYFPKVKKIISTRPNKPHHRIDREVDNKGMK